MWLNPVRAFIQTFKIWWADVKIHSSFGHPKQAALSKFPFLLNLPPIHLELYAFFLSLSLPTVNGSQFHITPRKLSRRFQPNRLIMMCQCRFILGKKKKKKDSILMSDIANGGSYACVRGGIYMYFPLNFAVSLKLL